MKDSQIILVKPIFKSMIWGGYKLSSIFKLQPMMQLGEAWVVSARNDGDCFISESLYQETNLSTFYKNNPAFFNFPKSEIFPFLFKFIDAKQKLSIQVHPDDEYALKHENSFGKNEAWIVLESSNKSTLLIGHHAKSKDELIKAIEDQGIENICNYVNPKPNDYFYIQAGTIHAIGSDVLLYEIQQNSNITYRVYDYGRLDDKNNPRELHLKKALDVIRFDSQKIIQDFDTITINDCQVTKYPSNPYFEVQRIHVNGYVNFELNKDFTIIGCIGGNGTINGIDFAFGTHAIASHSTKNLLISGNIDLVLTSPISHNSDHI
jgi:mannose-6-phosphate isomerase